MERPCSYSKCRGLFDELVETVTRPCLHCHLSSESQGAPYRLCLPCSSRAREVGPHAV